MNGCSRFRSIRDGCTNRQGANNGRTWWIPRGWFTSLDLSARRHASVQRKGRRTKFATASSRRERNVPGLLDLENRMNARYQRFGQRWQPENMQQPIVNGIRIYMALKGAGGGRGGAARRSPRPAAEASAGFRRTSPGIPATPKLPTKPRTAIT